MIKGKIKNVFVMELSKMLYLFTKQILKCLMYIVLLLGKLLYEGTAT